MSTTIHRLKQSARSIGLRFAGKLLYWVSQIHTNRDTTHGEIYWQDHLRWFLEGISDPVFSWFYAGSDEEIRAIYDAEIPPHHMNDRQLAEFRQFDRDEITGSCCQPRCRWYGPLSECSDDYLCPTCSKPVWIEPFEKEAA